MPWFKVTLSHEDIAAWKHIRLQETFTQLVTVYGAPKDVGMFLDPTIGIHEYYFSPGAVLIVMPLLAGYSGVACAAPARSAVRLLVGHDKSEAIPFAPEA
jgi:hypothetical protein